MSVLDNAPRASFDQIEFAYISRSMRSEFRHHVHEFPRMAGGDPDKLGRKVWLISYDCEFHASNPYIDDLYPGNLNALRDRFQRGQTAELVIPGVGIIRAFITKFEARLKAAIKSGESVSLEFCEDDLQPLRNGAMSVSREDLAQGVATLEAALTPENDSDLAAIAPYQKPLGTLLDLLNSVLGIRDQIELLGARASAQLAQLARLLRELESRMRGSDFYALRETLRGLWDSVTALQQDLLNQGPGSSLVTYVVPTTQAVGQIAQTLYGNASRGGELLALNPGITDPFAVDAGLPLVVYAA